MNAAEFIAKWRPVQLRERQACQEHFLDLCELLGHPKPAEMDPRGERFCFERGAKKLGGEDGWADSRYPTPGPCSGPPLHRWERTP